MNIVDKVRLQAYIAGRVAAHGRGYKAFLYKLSTSLKATDARYGKRMQDRLWGSMEPVLADVMDDIRNLIRQAG